MKYLRVIKIKYLFWGVSFYGDYWFDFNYLNKGFIMSCVKF